MKYISILKRMVQNSDHLVQNSHRSIEKLEAIVEGVSNQSRIVNDKLEALIQGSDNQSQLLNNKFGATIASLNNQMQLLQTMIRRQVSAFTLSLYPSPIALVFARCAIGSNSLHEHQKQLHQPHGDECPRERLEGLRQTDHFGRLCAGAHKPGYGGRICPTRAGRIK